MRNLDFCKNSIDKRWALLARSKKKYGRIVYVPERGITTASLHNVSFISILAKLCSPKFFSCLVSLNQPARIGLSYSLSSDQLISPFLFGVGCIPPVNYEDASRPRLNCTINCTLRAWYATMSSVIGRPWPRYRFLETIFGTSRRCCASSIARTICWKLRIYRHNWVSRLYTLINYYFPSFYFKLLDSRILLKNL